jgi:arginase family enzyme
MTDGAAANDLVVNAAFEPIGRADRLELVNPLEGIRLKATGGIAQIWKLGAVPPDLQDQAGFLSRLIDARFLVPRGAAETARAGVVRRSAHPLGPPWHSSEENRRPRWAIIGCAADFGAAQARPASGMSVVRRALSSRLGDAAPTDAYAWSTRSRVAHADLDVADYGDVLYDDAVDTAPQLHAKVAFAVGQVLDAGSLPMLIGGDHSLSYPAITQVARRHPGLRVVHLDAHADRRKAGGNGRTAHCGDFVDWVCKEAPGVRFLTIGVRGHDTNFDDRAEHQAVTYVTAEEVLRGGMPDTLREFAAGHPTYLTLDIDVLDPGFAPEVAYPSVGGLGHHHVSAIVAATAADSRLVGADFVEVCGSPTAANAAAARQADFIMTTLLQSAMRHVAPAVNERATTAPKEPRAADR